MPLRWGGHWQQRDDDRILEYLRDHDTANVSELQKELPRDHTYHIVKERLRVLAQANFVEPGPRHKNYELDTLGYMYLDGRVRADMLHPEPSPARPGYILR